jgi:hypothetical protein
LISKCEEPLDRDNTAKIAGENMLMAIPNGTITSLCA